MEIKIDQRVKEYLDSFSEKMRKSLPFVTAKRKELTPHKKELQQ